MATQEKTWNVANRLHSLKDSDNPEVNHIIAGADEIYDDTKGAKQSDINAQTDAALGDRYTKSETYSKEQLDSLITTPDANYVTVATFADLPQTGEANTIYRVSSYDGTQVDASKYALYAWNGATYQLLAVRSAVGEVFDVSEYNSGATYETLTAALAAVPASVQRGGMSIKFILRTNTGTEEEPVYHDEYVQYRLMNTDWSTVAGDWQGVDSELIAGSRNLVESGVVHNELALGAVYDVSAKNPTAGPNNDGKFESLSALLSDANLNTLIPTAYRKGGMSIKFVQSSDNKYVQKRLMHPLDNASTAATDFANTDNWQGIDETPTSGSHNLVESGGVKRAVLSVIGEMANKDVTVSGTATTPTGISLKSGVKYVIYVQCSTATTHSNTGIWILNGSSQFTMIALLTSEQYDEGYTMEYTPAEDVTLWVRPYSSGTVKVIVWKDSNYATLTEIASKQQEIVTNDIKNAIASEAFTYSDIVKTDGNLTSANITWPDGATGNMSITYTSGNPSQIDYTHVANGNSRSFRQTITYSNGEVASNTIVEL